MKIADAAYKQDPKALTTLPADTYSTVNNTNIRVPRSRVWKEPLDPGEAHKISGSLDRYLIKDSGEFVEPMDSEIEVDGT